MGSLYLESRVDPRSLAINKRYANNKSLPGEVRTAKINLMDDVFQAIMQTTSREWSPPNPASLFLSFSFPTLKSDIDGPIKHTIDAIQDGIQKAGYDWNDRYIWHLNVQRYHKDKKIGVALIPWESECTP